MGCWDDACIICGAPPTNIDKFYNEDGNEQLYEYYDQTLWLNKCTILLFNGDVVHDYEEITCNVTFAPSKKNINMTRQDYDNLRVTAAHDPFDSIYDFSIKRGIWMHDDCYKYCKKYLGIGLKFNNFPQNMIWIHETNADYGIITKYQSQDFMFGENYKDSNEWMVTSPLLKNSKAKKNRKRINKILAKFNLNPSQIKKRIKRPSPPISATIIKPKTYMIGNDNNMWYTNESKWTKDNDFFKKKFELKLPDIKKQHKRSQAIKTIFFKMEQATTKNPIFIMDADYKMKKDRINKGTFVFMSNKIGFEKLLKYFDMNNVKYSQMGGQLLSLDTFVPDIESISAIDDPQKYHKIKRDYLYLTK